MGGESTSSSFRYASTETVKMLVLTSAFLYNANKNKWDISVTDKSDNTQDSDPEQAWFWTDEWQAGEKQADKEEADGLGTFYASGEDFLAALDD